MTLRRVIREKQEEIKELKENYKNNLPSEKKAFKELIELSLKENFIDKKELLTWIFVKDTSFLHGPSSGKVEAYYKSKGREEEFNKLYLPLVKSKLRSFGRAKLKREEIYNKFPSVGHVWTKNHAFKIAIGIDIHPRRSLFFDPKSWETDLIDFFTFIKLHLFPIRKPWFIAVTASWNGFNVTNFNSPVNLPVFMKAMEEKIEKSGNAELQLLYKEVYKKMTDMEPYFIKFKQL